MALAHTTPGPKIVLHRDRPAGTALKKITSLNVCRSAPATQTSQKLQPSAPNDCTEIRHVSTGQTAFRTCTVLLGEVSLPLLMDTGAAASLLNASTYHKLFSHLPLQQPCTSLCGYDSSKITMLGVLHVPVRYGSKHLPSFPFYITERGANLLGLDLFTCLGFTLWDDKGSDIHHVTTTWQQRWPALFDGLGCLTAFTHRPLVDPEVSPVIQPLRRIPLALRDEVTAELQMMLAMGVIEPVNAAPWISNLVIARKKSGGIRVCVDLRSVNKAVIPDKYPLPTAEELTTHFYGSTVFTKLDLRQGYLQVPLHPSSRNLTAFVHRDRRPDLTVSGAPSPRFVLFMFSSVYFVLSLSPHAHRLREISATGCGYPKPAGWFSSSRVAAPPGPPFAGHHTTGLPLTQCPPARLWLNGRRTASDSMAAGPPLTQCPPDRRWLNARRPPLTLVPWIQSTRHGQESRVCVLLCPQEHFNPVMSCLVRGDSSGAGSSSCCGRGGHSSHLPPCRRSGSGCWGTLWGPLTPRHAQRKPHLPSSPRRASCSCGMSCLVCLAPEGCPVLSCTVLSV